MATPEARPPTDLRDGPFRARARIGSDGPERLPTSIAVLAVVAVGIVIVGLFGPRTGRPVVDAADPIVSLPPDLPTPLPPLLLAGPSGDGARSLEPIPVLGSGGGIRWADPRTGGLTDMVVGGAGRAAAYQLADGSLVCVCLESPWRREGRTVRVVIIRMGPDGQERGGGRSVELSTPLGGRRQRDGIGIDAAFDVRRGHIYVAHSTRAEAAWEVGLDVIDVDSGAVIDSVALPAPPPGDLLRPPILRLAPDAGSVRVGLVSIPGGLDDRALTDEARSDWLVPVADGRLGGPIALPPLRFDGPCTAEAFVTVEVLARLCRATPESSAPTIAVLDAGAAGRHEVALGGGGGRTVWHALADRARSRLLLWDADRHELVTIDALTGVLEVRFLPADDEAIADHAPSGLRPAPSGVRAAWGQTGSPFGLPGVAPLIGSPDGSLVLATGHANDRGRGSTGVWVFDAATFELVERWPAASSYVQLAWSPDGRFVYAMGESLVDTFGRPAPWGRTLAIHDGLRGDLLALLGAIEGIHGTPLAFPSPAE